LPDARLLIVNRGEQEFIRGKTAAHGISPEQLEIVAATHDEVPALIRRMTAAMAFYKVGYSRLACCPTKLGEYLGCGVPCLASAAVGDVAQVIESRRLGVALEGYSDHELKDTIARIVELTRDARIQERCRSVATELFSLQGGVEAYSTIYDALSQESG
jgi:glycosyltransferase involved in cell wall biosynthesis